MTFSIGSVVKLKSGGPAMTVWGIRGENGLTEVEWFVDKELKRDAFHLDELMDMAEIAGAQAEFHRERLAIEREIWGSYKDVSFTNKSPAIIVDGSGWAEAAFDEGPPDPQVLSMMLRARQGLGYRAFAGFK